MNAGAAGRVLLTLATACANSGAWEPSHDGAGSLLKLTRSQPAPATVSTAKPSLSHKPCGLRKTCFFDEEWNLLYWTTEYVQSGQPPKRVLITGSTDVLRKHLKFRAWLRSVGPQLGLSPEGMDEVDLPFSGRLNMRTLNIPAERAMGKALELWLRWQADCRLEAQGASEDTQATCDADLLLFHFGEDWSPYPGPRPKRTDRRGLERPIPSEILRARAERIDALFSQAFSFKEETKKAAPLTKVWDSLDDPEWLRLGERDHLEPDQLPMDLVRRLIELEKLMDQELNAAELLEQAHRSQLYPEGKP